MLLNNLNIKYNNIYKDIIFNNNTIHVKTYLAAADKYDLIQITMQKAKEGNLYNPFKLDLYFHLHLIYMYTDIEFTDEDREDEFALYDHLKESGLMTAVINAIDEDEYAEIFSFIEEEVDKHETYDSSTAAIVEGLIQDLPKNAAAAAEIVNSFDPNKFQAVVDFAQAANGDRPISPVK